METMGNREAVKLPKQVDAHVLLTRTQLVFCLFKQSWLRVLQKIFKSFLPNIEGIFIL